MSILTPILAALGVNKALLRYIPYLMAGAAIVGFALWVFEIRSDLDDARAKNVRLTSELVEAKARIKILKRSMELQDEIDNLSNDDLRRRLLNRVQ